MGKSIKEKNEALLTKVMRKIGMPEKKEKVDEAYQKCVEELGEDKKWSKAQIAMIVGQLWMKDTSKSMDKSLFGDKNPFDDPFFKKF